jgi:hypothetical protein
MLGVICLVAEQLLLPKVFSRLWPFKQVAIVLMPKTTMNKNHGSQATQHNVGLSRQISHMKPITETRCMKSLSNNQLRPGIFPTYASHHPAAHIARDNVRQLVAS